MREGGGGNLGTLRATPPQWGLCGVAVRTDPDRPSWHTSVAIIVWDPLLVIAYLRRALARFGAVDPG